MTVQEKTIQVNNLNVRYWESDEEHPRALLLVQGGIGSAEMHWKHLIPVLGDSYHVIAPDLPGFGKSDRLPTMSVEALATWLRDLLNALRINQAAVIGNSFGGLVTRVFAATYPERAPAAVLVNGGNVPVFPPVMRMLVRLPVLNNMVLAAASQSQASAAGLKELAYIDDIVTDALVRQAQTETKGLAEVLRLLIVKPRPTQLTPSVPVLLLWGAEDTVVPISVAQRLQAKLPAAELVPVTQCGHFPHLETPEVFTFQVRRFLDKQSAVSTGELPGLPLQRDWR